MRLLIIDKDITVQIQSAFRDGTEEGSKQQKPLQTLFRSGWVFIN